MPAKSQKEVSEILEGDAFSSWLERLNAARDEKRLAAARVDELKTQVNLLNFRSELSHEKAIDTLYQADSLEHESAIFASEAAELDNASFEAVSAFEKQRGLCTELWGEQGRLELEAEKAEGAGKEAKAKDIRADRQKKAAVYEKEVAVRTRLWAEVEDLWQRSIEKSLTLHELKHKGQVVRKRANRLFEEYEASQQKSEELRSRLEEVRQNEKGADETHESLKSEGRSLFDAILKEDFLYWPSQEDNTRVFVTPLINDDENYALPLVAGDLYRCDRRLGIDGLMRVHREAPMDSEKVPVDAAADDK